MSAESDKPIVLKEVCEYCSKPIFPTRSGSTSSILHRPGFCNCALRQALDNAKGANPSAPGKDKAANPNETYLQSALADQAERAEQAEQADQVDEDGPGYNIKLTGTAEVPKFELDGLRSPRLTRDDIVRPPGSKFDPNIQLTDLIAAGYTFFDRVGKGTMGYVYQAKSDNLDALLAIKIFHRAPFKNKRTLKRLEQEASVALGIAHPHLASVYKFGVSEKNILTSSWILWPGRL